MTLSKQTSLFTETKSTSSQVDSHANHSALQEKEKAQMMNAICGTKCCEQFNRFSQHTLWQKMFVDCLLSMAAWSSSRCVLTWKLKATKFNRYYCQLQVSTRHIEETESLLWLTPSTIDIKPSEERKKKRTEYRESIGRKWAPGSLTEQIYDQLLPTPRTSGQESYETRAARKGHDSAMSYLESHVDYLHQQKLLPTPRANDMLHPQTDGKAFQHRKNRHYMAEVVMAPHMEPGKTSQLNPRFVAEMMGFPTDWTILPFLNGETKA